MRPVLRRIPAGVALLVLVGACANDDADRDTAEPTTTTTTTTTTTESGPGDTMPDPAEPTPTATTAIELNPEKPIPVTPSPRGADEPWFPGQIDPGLAPFVDLATDDLAARLDIAPADITTVSAVLVTWPDTSLGCPMPGMEYAQVLQDGSLIELEYDADVYRYHSGGSQTPVLCATSSVMPTTVVGITDDE